MIPWFALLAHDHIRDLPFEIEVHQTEVHSTEDVTREQIGWKGKGEGGCSLNRLCGGCTSGWPPHKWFTAVKEISPLPSCVSHPISTQFKGECNSRNLGVVVCVAQVDLSPKHLSNPGWTITRSTSLMNVTIGHECH